MQFAVLVANPQANALAPAMVEEARRALDGGTPRWLSEDEAAEVPLTMRVDDTEPLRAALSEQGVDFGIVGADHREKRLLLADMDSTMIGQECIDELAAMAGVGPQVAEVTARAMNGELEFEGALRARVALLAGLPETVIADVLSERITHAAGGRTLIATMRARGAYTALVSGGFTAFTGPVAAALGFHEHRANTLLVADGLLTGKVSEPILGRAAKVDALEELAAQLGVGLEHALAVGDGANDLGMLTRAGLGVALHAKPVVAAQCGVRIDHGDLTALLYLQGIRRADFVATA